MSIRVTNSYIINQNMYDINKNLQILQDYQLKLSTGLDINRPSDDPVGITQALKIKTSINEGEQYQDNITEGNGRIAATIGALTRVEELLLEIQGLTYETISSANASVSRSVISTQLNGLLDELLINANTKYLGRYVFGGHETLNKPYLYSMDGSGNIVNVQRNRLMNGTDEIKGIDDLIYRTTADGIDLAVNLSGSRPFMPTGEGTGDDIFNTIINIRDHVQNMQIDDLKNDVLELNDQFERIVSLTTKMGETQSRLSNIRANNDNTNVTMQANLSEILNVDFAKAITEMQYQQFIFESSLQVGAKIIPMSLLDFI
ncbi:MAG: flagellar hook-associated protein FlgL [uncultured bacterium]|nr:MAG: flagellar hook-associated protein FlgL [uncultured bacterium]